ncbi:hypothetical protein CDL15_Pgr018964 [Punica granatum]|uniref:Uncharacterized protein n=1 Tax=Punica granatum TaxID=22663 RepID=A0A218WM34_PUNGR|nr:hypothetical protein CDL15_Pgr018964 [Punica granatum]
MPPRKQPTANVKEAPGVESAAALPATVKDPTSGGKADPVIMLSRSVEIMAVDIKQGQHAMDRSMESVAVGIA